MDANTSTIGKQWWMCITASFIGCIVLVYCLHHRHNSYNLSTFQRVATSITSFEPSSRTGLIEHTKLIENEKHLDGEESKCSIFDGSWVYEPNGNVGYTAAECPFLSDQVSCRRNGRPDFEYERWSWEAKGCVIPRFNATNMLEILRGKRMIIVGDSLNRNQWESLACLLYSAIPSSRAHVDVANGFYKVFKAKDYNCSVEYYWSPFLVELKEKNLNGSRILRLDKPPSSAKKWRGADVMVFNTGHWWVHNKKIKAWDLFEFNGQLAEKMNIEDAFDIGIRTWSRWIDRNVDRNKTTVFFRSISPEHKEKKWCHNRTQPTMDPSSAYGYPQSIKEIVERAIRGMKTPVMYLNITNLSAYRRDAHPAIYARKQEKPSITEKQLRPELLADCSHWCLPGLPDTWNRLLYASLILGRSQDITNK